MAPTDFIKDRFIQYNPNSFSVKNYTILNQTFEPVDFKKKKNEVIYVGSITRARGIVEMVKSFEQVEATFQLAGSFEPKSLRNEIKLLPGWKKVNELGFIEQDKVVELLKRAKVGLVILHPIVNYLNALPVKMFEYMAVGVPIIASRIPVLHEVLRPDVNCLMASPSDVSEWSTCIDRLYRDERLRERIGATAHAEYKRSYTWAHRSRAMLELIGE